jgi:hypothetical protein
MAASSSARLGDLIEVTVRGGGYHSEQDVQHVVFLYRAPCNGMVFGSGTNGLHVGRYAKRATAAVITKACSDTSCTLSMPGGGSNQLLNSTPSGWEAVAAQRYEQ